MSCRCCLPQRHPLDDDRPDLRTHGTGGRAAGRLHALAAARLRRRACCAAAAALRLHVRVQRRRSAPRRGDADGRERGLGAAPLCGGRAGGARRGARRARAGQSRACASGAVLRRVRLLHRAERVPRTRRSGVAGLSQMQRALPRLHLRAGTRRGNAVAANARRRRGRRAGSRAHRDPPPRARRGRHRLVRAGVRGRAAAAVARRSPRDRDDSRASVPTARSISTRTAACPRCSQRCIDVGPARRANQLEFVPAHAFTRRTTAPSATG